MRRQNGEGIEVDVAWIVLAVIVVLYLFSNTGCNGADLTRGASSPSPTSTSSWSTPPPGGDPYVIAYVGPKDCYGNASADQVFAADPDDPPAEYDAYVCAWLCAVDPHLVQLGLQGATSPAELIEVWDFDAPAAPTQYIDGVTHPWIAGYPMIRPCNAPLP